MVEEFTLTVAVSSYISNNKSYRFAKTKEGFYILKYSTENQCTYRRMEILNYIWYILIRKCSYLEIFGDCFNSEEWAWIETPQKDQRLEDTEVNLRETSEFQTVSREEFEDLQLKVQIMSKKLDNLSSKRGII